MPLLVAAGEASPEQLLFESMLRKIAALPLPAG
jgi:hypothetical protein